MSMQDDESKHFTLPHARVLLVDDVITNQKIAKAFMTHYEMQIDSFGVKWIVHSTSALNAGEVTGMTVLPKNLHIMKKTGSGAESGNISRLIGEGVDINDI